MIKIKQNKKQKGRTADTKVKGLFTRLDKLKFLGVPKQKLIVAHVQRVNGDKYFKVVKVLPDNTFVIGVKTYIVAEDYLEFNASFNMYVGLYHENISTPIKQYIPHTELKQSAKATDNPKYIEVINNIDPLVLTEWNKSKVIQDTIKGQKYQDAIQKFAILMWLILVFSGLTLLLVLNMSGLF